MILQNICDEELAPFFLPCLGSLQQRSAIPAALIMQLPFTLRALVAIAAISSASPLAPQRRQGDTFPLCGGDPATPKKHLCFSTEYERIITEDGMSLWYHCIDQKKPCNKFAGESCWDLHNNMVPFRARQCFVTTYESIPVGKLVEGYGYKANPKCPMGQDLLCTGEYKTPPIPDQSPVPKPQPSYTPDEIAAMPEPDRPRVPGGTIGDSWEILNTGKAGFRMHCKLDMATFKDGKGTQHCTVFYDDEAATVAKVFDRPYTEQIGDAVEHGFGPMLLKRVARLWKRARDSVRGRAAGDQFAEAPQPLCPGQRKCEPGETWEIVSPAYLESIAGSL